MGEASTETAACATQTQGTLGAISPVLCNASALTRSLSCGAAEAASAGAASRQVDAVLDAVLPQTRGIGCVVGVPPGRAKGQDVGFPTPDGSHIIMDGASGLWREHTNLLMPFHGKNLLHLIEELCSGGYVVSSNAVDLMTAMDVHAEALLSNEVVQLLGVADHGTLHRQHLLLYAAGAGDHGAYVLVPRALGKRDDRSASATVKALVKVIEKGTPSWFNIGPRSPSGYPAVASWMFWPLQHFHVPNQGRGRPGANTAASHWAAAAGLAAPPLLFPVETTSSLIAKDQCLSAVLLGNAALWEARAAASGLTVNDRTLVAHYKGAVARPPFLSGGTVCVVDDSALAPSAEAVESSSTDAAGRSPSALDGMFRHRVTIGGILGLCGAKSINPGDAKSVSPAMMQCALASSMDTAFVAAADPPAPTSSVRVTIGVDTDSCVGNYRTGWWDFHPPADHDALKNGSEENFVIRTVKALSELLGETTATAELSKGTIFSEAFRPRAPTAAGAPFRSTAKQRVPLPAARMAEPFRMSATVPHDMRNRLWEAEKTAAAAIVTHLPCYFSKRTAHVANTLDSSHAASMSNATVTVPGGPLLALTTIAIMSFRLSRTRSLAAIIQWSAETYNFKLRGGSVIILKDMLLEEARASDWSVECASAATELARKSNMGATGILRRLHQFFYAHRCPAASNSRVHLGETQELLVAFGYHVSTTIDGKPGWSSLRGDLTHLAGWQPWAEADAAVSESAAAASSNITGERLIDVVLPGGDAALPVSTRDLAQSVRARLDAAGTTLYAVGHLPTELHGRTTNYEADGAPAAPAADTVRSQIYYPFEVFKGATGEAGHAPKARLSASVGTAQHVPELPSLREPLRVDVMWGAWAAKFSAMVYDFGVVARDGADVRNEILTRMRPPRPPETSEDVEAEALLAGLTDVLSSIESRDPRPIAQYMLLNAAARHELAVAALVVLKGNAGHAAANEAEQLHLVRMATEYSGFLARHSSGERTASDRRIFAAPYGVLAGRCLLSGAANAAWRVAFGVDVPPTGAVFAQNAAVDAAMRAGTLRINDAPQQYVDSVRPERWRVGRRANALKPAAFKGELPVCAACMTLFSNVDGLEAHLGAIPSHKTAASNADGSFDTANSAAYVNHLNTVFASWKDPTQVAAFRWAAAGHNVLMLGAAGSGKSYTSRLTATWQTLKLGPLSVAICGTTGAAARVASSGGLDASTVHSWGGLGKFEYFETAEDIARRICKSPTAQASWLACRVLLLEEAGNLTAAAFDKLNRVAQLVRGDPRSFGGLQLVFSGSFLQMGAFSEWKGNGFPLPSMEDKLPFFMARTYRDVFARSDIFYLDTTHRLRGADVSVRPAVEIFNRMQFGLSSADDIAALNDSAQFGARAAEMAALVETDPSSVVDPVTNVRAPHDPLDIPLQLNFLRAQVRDGNAKLLDKLPGLSVRVEACDTRNGNPVPTFNFERYDAPPFVVIKEGARVASNRNLSYGRVVNGDLGDVVTILVKGAPLPPLASVPSGVLHARANEVQVLVRFLDGREVWIAPFEFSPDTHKGDARTATPLRAAWHVTVNAAQGMTCRYVVVNCHLAFGTGTVYTATLRATSIAGTRVVGLLAKHIKVDARSLQFTLSIIKDKAPSLYAWYAGELASYLKALGRHALTAEEMEDTAAAKEAAAVYESLVASHAVHSAGATAEAQLRHATTGPWRSAEAAAVLHSMDGLLDKRAAVLHAVSAGATGAAGLDEEIDLAEEAAADADQRPDFDELAPEEARVSAEEEEEDGIGGSHDADDEYVAAAAGAVDATSATRCDPYGGRPKSSYFPTRQRELETAHRQTCKACTAEFEAASAAAAAATSPAPPCNPFGGRAVSTMLPSEASALLEAHTQTCGRCATAEAASGAARFIGTTTAPPLFEWVANRHTLSGMAVAPSTAAAYAAHRTTSAAAALAIARAADAATALAASTQAAPIDRLTAGAKRAALSERGGFPQQRRKPRSDAAAERARNKTALAEARHARGVQWRRQQVAAAAAAKAHASRNLQAAATAAAAATTRGHAAAGTRIPLAVSDFLEVVVPRLECGAPRLVTGALSGAATGRTVGVASGRQ